MYYLFILESIGTSELILIGLIALIVFGPRKLPEFARTVGKYMNEFRRTTEDFKQTWAREVDFESEFKDDKAILTSDKDNQLPIANLTGREKIAAIENEIAAPEIKELSQTEFNENFPKKGTQSQTEPEPNLNNKRDWL
jgi:Tat protein translocase TatB subunit